MAARCSSTRSARFHSTSRASSLRVLQERSFERVGEERTRAVDVRLVAATNRDLKEEVRQGRFRGDLYFRLNVFPISATPLRERPEDIPLIAQHMLTGAAHRLGVPEPRLTEGDVRRLIRYGWPATCANWKT